MIKLLLVDDHTIVRNLLRDVFSASGEIEVIGDVGSGEAALDFLKNTSANALNQGFIGIVLDCITIYPGPQRPVQNGVTEMHGQANDRRVVAGRSDLFRSLNSIKTR